jgi:hypothetical protein
MPAEIRIVDQKFYSKLNNGDDFTINDTTDFSRHLKGGVLEELKAVINVQINWYMAINTYSYFYDDVASTLRIEAKGKNWISGGFSVGDKIKFSVESSQLSPIKSQIEGDITSITDGEIIINNVVETQKGPLGAGLPSGLHLIEGEDDYVTGITKKTALKFDFGLIENDEPINFLSKLTNTDQTYLFEDINHNTNAFVSGKSFGNNKAAYTGSAQVKFVGLSLDKDYVYNENTTQEFQIEHIFKINPFYRDGEIDSLKGIDKPPLDIYNGALSLKYVFQTEFRTVLSNPNTSMVSSYDTQLGSVGYLDESYNGYESNYTISDLAYKVNGNDVDRLEIGSVTTVTFNINNSKGTFTGSNNNIIVGHTAIVDSLSYSFNKNTYSDVWTDEDLRGVADISPTTYNGTIIKNFTPTSLSNSIIGVTFDIEFTSEQELILEDKQDYLLYFTIQDSAKNVDNGDKVTGRIDVNYYYKNTDVEGLFDFDKFEQYPHPEEFEEGVSVGFTDALTFNESGMMADGRFWVVNESTLNDLKFDIAVYKFSDDTWDSLRSLVIDLSDQVTVNGVQQIELDSTRGYVLKDGDIFNYLKITTDNNDGTKQYYNIQVGYRIPWQSWLEFKDSPVNFYDKSKNFNGLNQKTSNYSMVDGDYGIKVLFDAIVDSTNYVKTSQEIEVYDYDEDDQNPTAWTCEIKTFKKDPLDPNSIVEIAGNVIQDGYTQFQALFKPLVPPVFTQSVDMSNVATLNDPITDPLGWYRFAHGNYYTKTDTFQTRRLGLNNGVGWTNDQANDVGTSDITGDTFRNTDNSISRNKNASDLYTSTPTQILADQNLGAFYGCYSLLEYEFYQITGTMYSTSSDNDGLLYQIAFFVDEFGVEHTLSLAATTGGVAKNTNYVSEDPLSDMWLYSGNECNWSLVYDYGKGDEEDSYTILDQFFTGETGFGWSAVGDLDFDIKRSGDVIEVTVDWLINGTPYNNTFNYNLNDNLFTEKFKGFSKIGFGFHSQNQGGFKDVFLTAPQDEFYVEMRIDPKESQSDFSDNRISSIIEAPENNLLKQITGDIKTATLQWDAINEKFIGQCLIETSLVKSGENYDLSAELRPLNLEA